MEEIKREQCTDCFIETLMEVLEKGESDKEIVKNINRYGLF